jgi:WD40 repeat protein
LVETDGAERIVEAHGGAILTVAPERDGKGLITAGDDGKVMRVSADGGAEILAVRPRKWIDQVAAGPDGAVAFASSRQAVVRFADGRQRPLDMARAVGGLAFAQKGFRLAIARYNGVTLWMANTDAEPVSLEWNGAHIGVMFSPDGRYVVTSMQESALHAWRLDDGRDMRMTGYPAKPRSLSWSAKGRFLASSGANAAVLWPFHGKDGPMGKQPLQLGAREALVTAVACHPRLETVAIGYQDGSILMVAFADGEETALRPAGGGPVSALAFDSRGERLAFGTEAGAGGVIDMGG